MMKLRILSSLLLLLGSSATAWSYVLPLTFSVDVQTRETHDDVAGFTVRNWLKDTSFEMQSFSIDVSLDTDDIEGRSGFAFMEATANLLSVPSSRLTSEVQSLAVSYPFQTDFSTFRFQENDFPGAESGTVSFVSSIGGQDTPFAINASELSNYSLSLRYGYDSPTFDTQQFLDGLIPNANDMINLLEGLSSTNVEFDFEESVLNYDGSLNDYTSNRGYQTGLRYSGSARLVSVGSVSSVPVMETHFLLTVGLILLNVFQLNKSRINVRNWHPSGP